MKDLKQRKILRFIGHVHRVITILDQLYEFGPTLYYARLKTVEDAYLEFEAALSSLSVESINLGLERLTNIHDRKRITPSPEDFFDICISSEENWKWIKKEHKKEVE